MLRQEVVWQSVNPGGLFATDELEKGSGLLCSCTVI
jgi:hypothetical protein